MDLSIKICDGILEREREIEKWPVKDWRKERRKEKRAAIFCFLSDVNEIFFSALFNTWFFWAQ